MTRTKSQTWDVWVGLTKASIINTLTLLIISNTVNCNKSVLTFIEVMRKYKSARVGVHEWSVCMGVRVWAFVFMCVCVCVFVCVCVGGWVGGGWACVLVCCASGNWSSNFLSQCISKKTFFPKKLSAIFECNPVRGKSSNNDQIKFLQL